MLYDTIVAALSLMIILMGVILSVGILLILVWFSFFDDGFNLSSFLILFFALLIPVAISKYL
jgi:hypothetical protein